MANKYVGAAKFFANLITGGKPKTTGTEVIKNFKIAPNLGTKRNIQDNVVSAVDSAFKKADVPPSLRNQQKKSKLKKDESKKLKGFSYKLDKLQEKIENKAKGGRVGLKRGTSLIPKKKSNVQKIQETFGPGSSNPKKSAAKKKKFPDLTGDGKVTFADILKGRGVKRG
jgi:hypothetical protein